MAKSPAMQPHPVPDPPSTLKDDHAHHIDIDYRQLVSRASTQRIHSPSLSVTRTILHPDPHAQWELDERRLFKAKIMQRLHTMDISWDAFMRDIEQAEQETHVLLPSTYDPTSARNRTASKGKQKDVYENLKRKECGIELWRHIEVLRSLGKARMAATQQNAPST